MDRNERINDQNEAVRIALQGLQRSIWTAMPAVVTAVNMAEMTVSAQPTIMGQQRTQDGKLKFITMPLCVDVPIVYQRGGGFSMTFPIKVEDEGLLVFASRCIDAWWQSGKVQVPLEMRMHNLSDGFMIVGPTSQPHVLSPTVDVNNLQIRSDDGQAVFEMKPNHDVNLTTVGDITLNGKKININATQNITVTGTRWDWN